MAWHRSLRFHLITWPLPPADAKPGTGLTRTNTHRHTGMRARKHVECTKGSCRCNYTPTTAIRGGQTAGGNSWELHSGRREQKQWAAPNQRTQGHRRPSNYRLNAANGEVSVVVVQVLECPGISLPGAKIQPEGKKRIKGMRRSSPRKPTEMLSMRDKNRINTFIDRLQDTGLL